MLRICGQRKLHVFADRPPLVTADRIWRGRGWGADSFLCVHDMQWVEKDNSPLAWKWDVQRRLVLSPLWFPLVAVPLYCRFLCGVFMSTAVAYLRYIPTRYIKYKMYKTCCIIKSLSRRLAELSPITLKLSAQLFCPLFTYSRKHENIFFSHFTKLYLKNVFEWCTNLALDLRWSNQFEFHKISVTIRMILYRMCLKSFLYTFWLVMVDLTRIRTEEDM
jgi:hypothetical protein